MELRRLLPALAAGLILAVLVALGARPGLASDGQHDHDRARQALEAGEVLPLRTILDRVEREHPGQIMEVELERKRDRWIYEIKLLRGDGALVKLEIDARNGSVLGIKGRAERQRRHGDER